MMLALPVAQKEFGGFLAHLLEITEIGVFPNVAIVLLMEPFDRTIALWVINRREQEFRADHQGEPDHQAHNMGMGRTATKAAFIIHLGVVRNANLLPYLDQKVRSIAGAPLGVGIASGIA